MEGVGALKAGIAAGAQANRASSGGSWVVEVGVGSALCIEMDHCSWGVVVVVAGPGPGVV